MSNALRAHLALISATVLYGINYNVAKQLIPEPLAPFALVLARILGTTLLFWISQFFLPVERVGRSDLMRLLLAALFGVAVNQSLFLNGLNLSSPIDASIIMTATPILVLVVSRIILREPITLLKILGIISGGAGALLLILYRGGLIFDPKHMLGNTMIFANAGSYALYLVLIKPLMSKYHPVTLMKWVFLFGLIMVSIPSAHAFHSVSWGQMSSTEWASLFYVVIGVTFMAYLLNIYGLRYVKPITIGIYVYAQPVIASLIAMFLGQDRPTPVKIISALLVFAGVWFVSYSSSRTGKNLEKQSGGKGADATGPAESSDRL